MGSKYCEDLFCRRNIRLLNETENKFTFTVNKRDLIEVLFQEPNTTCTDFIQLLHRYDSISVTVPFWI